MDSTGPPPGARLPPDLDPPEGRALILMSRPDGTPLRGNPFAIIREIRSICDSEVEKTKQLGSGKILISTFNKDQSSALLSCQTMLGKPVSAVLATNLMSSQGLIHCPDLSDLSDEELLTELAPQGVIEVQRLKSKDRTPNPLIRLRFKGLDLPRKLLCGYLSVPVRPWIQLPRQCRRCWKLGHSMRSCRRKETVCGQCSARDSHPTGDCTSVPKCPLCSGPHPAWDRNSCPVWKTTKRDTRERAPFQPPPLNSTAWPPLESQHRTMQPPPARTDASVQTDGEVMAPKATAVPVQTQTETASSQTTDASTQTTKLTTFDSTSQTRPARLVSAEVQTDTPDSPTPTTDPDDFGCSRSRPFTRGYTASFQPDSPRNDTDDPDPDLIPKRRPRGEIPPPDIGSLKFEYASGRRLSYPPSTLYWFDHEIRLYDLDLRPESKAYRAAVAGFYFDGPLTTDAVSSFREFLQRVTTSPTNIAA